MPSVPEPQGPGLGSLLHPGLWILKVARGGLESALVAMNVLPRRSREAVRQTLAAAGLWSLGPQDSPPDHQHYRGSDSKKSGKAQRVLRTQAGAPGDRSGALLLTAPIGYSTECREIGPLGQRRPLDALVS